MERIGCSMVALGGFWERFGKVLGWFWDGFGMVLESTLGALWGISWILLGASGSFWGIQSRAFFKHGPNMDSKRPPGSMLGPFGEGFGKILGGFGKVWGRIWEGFTRKNIFPADSGNAGYNLARLQQSF